jgi:predicted enzyme related to lactoylglutathione lyase
MAEGEHMSRPVHFEIHGDDPAKAAAFYREVFGWQVSRWGDQDYWLFETGDGPGIDGASAPTQEHRQKVVLTMEADDLASAVERARRAGGTVLLDEAPIPGVGWLAQVLDPNGVLFGIMQPDENAS